MPSLLIAKPDGQLIQEHTLDPRATVVIGRGIDCDVVVRSDRVSRHHVVIFEHDGKWYAVDLDSTAGMSFDEEPVEVHEFTLDRLWIRVGPVVVWLEDWVPRPQGPRPTMPSALEGVGSGMPRAGRDHEGVPFLQRADSPRPLFIHFRDTTSGDRRLFDFAEADRVTFGRNPACDLVVDTLETLDLHSLLYREGPLWKLLELQPIDRANEPDRRRRIRMLDGMPIRIGGLRGTVLIPEAVVQDGVANLSIGARLDDVEMTLTEPKGGDEDEFSPSKASNHPKP